MSCHISRRVTCVTCETRHQPLEVELQLYKYNSDPPLRPGESDRTYMSYVYYYTAL